MACVALSLNLDYQMLYHSRRVRRSVGFGRFHLTKFPSWWLLVPILLYVFWLGGHDLNTNPFWGDEWASVGDIGGVFTSPGSPAQIWNRVAEHNPWHSPGFFILLGGWERLVGETPAALRTLSLFVGLVSVALMYRLGRLAISERGGVLAALLFGTSILFVHYLTKVRMYGQLLCLTMLVFYLYLRLVEQKRAPTFASLLVLALGTVALLYTHYFAFVPLGTIAIYHLLFVPKNRAWWLVTGTFVVAGCFFLPWFSVLLTAINTEETLARATVAATEVLERLLFIIGNGNSMLAIGLLVTGVLGVALYGQARRFGFLVFVAVSLLLVVNAVVTPVTYGRPRYMLVAWPVVFVFVAFGLEALARNGLPGRLVSGAVVVVMLVGSCLSVEGRLLSQQVDEFDYIFPMHVVQQHVGAFVQPQDVVVSFVPDDISEGYREITRDNAFFFSQNYQRDYVVTATEFYPGQAGEEARYRASLAESKDRLWLTFLNNHPTPALNEYQSLLAETHVLCPSPVMQGDLQINQYAQSPVCCISTFDTPSAQVQFGEWYEVLASDVSRVDGQMQIDVVVSWRVSQSAPLHQYSTTVQLFDEAGEKVAQVDYGIDPSTYFCHEVSLETEALLPGRYEVRVGVYNWQTGEHLMARDSESAAEESMPLLTTLSIEG